MAGDYYSRVSGRFWIDTKGWGDRNQLVALYLLTNTHRSMEGLYHLPLGYLCADLAITSKQATEALRFIQEQDLIAYDAEAEVVFIRKALKHGAPKTEKHIIGAVNRLKGVPFSPLWNEFLMACECHANGLANAIRMAWPTLFESSSSSSNTTTPFIPQGGTSPVAPSKPVGNRKTDLAKYDEAMAVWCAEHFPAAVSVQAVESTITWARFDGPVTADALRAVAQRSDLWASQLGLEVAA